MHTITDTPHWGCRSISITLIVVYKELPIPTLKTANIGILCRFRIVSLKRCSKQHDDGYQAIDSEQDVRRVGIASRMNMNACHRYFFLSAANVIIFLKDATWLVIASRKRQKKTSPAYRYILYLRGRKRKWRNLSNSSARILPFVSEKMRTFALETFGDKSHSPQVNLGNSFGKENRRISSTEKTLQCGLLLILLPRHS